MINLLFSSWLRRAIALILPLLLLLLALILFVDVGDAHPKTAGGLGLWINFLGTLHPLFLHLPIGGLLLLFVLEGLRLLGVARVSEEVTLVAVGFSLLFGWLALVFGYALYLTGSYEGDLMDKHKRDALVFFAFLLIAFLCKVSIVLDGRRGRAAQGAYGMFLLAAAGTMGLAGHHGGMMTHGDPMEQLPPVVLEQRKLAEEALRNNPRIYEHVVGPILEEGCVYCHGAEKQEGTYRMDSYQALVKGGESGKGLVPGNLEQSAILARLALPKHDKHHMPPSDKPQLTEEEILLLKWWVQEGAPEHASLEDLQPDETVHAAIASLGSPAERKAREAEEVEAALAARRAVQERKHALQPALDAFDARYPAALQYRANGSTALRFSAVSYLDQFQGEGLEQLDPFVDELEEMNFSMAVLDDAAAEFLGRCKNLKRLNLSFTSVSDVFVSKLAGLPHLELLNLYGTRVTGEVAASLMALPALQTLYISNTGLSPEQTIALRKQLAADRETPVDVVGIDQQPDLALLSEEGMFRRALEQDEERYGSSIAGAGTVTLSSQDLRYSPPNGLAAFTAETAPDLEFAFHTRHELEPWVQIRFESPRELTAFELRNRANLPQRADALALERQLPDGSWEALWTASAPEVHWMIDLSDNPAESRRATNFRFILKQKEPAMLHLAHLALWGRPVTTEDAPDLEGLDNLSVTGQGDWVYVAEPGWGQDPQIAQLGPTHGGVVVDEAGRVFVSTDGPKGIVVFRRDGTYLRHFAQGQGRYHGLCLHTEEGEQFLYAADNGHIAKYRLNGERVLTIAGAAQAEGNRWSKATAVAVGPQGGIFIADGYGSSTIFKYDRSGKFLKKFGSRGPGEGQFITSHGLAVDTRDPQRPLLVVCDRENRRLQHFTLDGSFVDIPITGLRRPCSVAIRDDAMVVAELAGRAVILDRDYKVVSELGDNPVAEQHANFHVHPHQWKDGVFNAPHGVAFDHNGDVYIQDWNQWGRITKLRRQRSLTGAELERIAEAATGAADAAGETDWTPKELDQLTLWLDADDLTTITATSGRVSQWDDKSGKGHHAYALAPEERPRIGTLRLNRRQALEFQQARLVRKGPEQGNWQDLFIVADWNGPETFKNYNGLFTGFQGGIGIIGNSRAEGQGLWLLEKWWSSLWINARSHDGKEVMSLFADPFLVSCSADNPINITGFGIGNDRSFTGAPEHWRAWDGAVCEIVAFSRKLTEAERQQVEGYLAHKWGLTAVLPDDHPFHHYAPGADQ